MTAQNRQFLDLHGGQGITQLPQIHPEILASQGRLDGDLPKTRHAAKEGVVRILEQLAGDPGEPIALAYRPKKNVRIQQDTHSDPTLERSEHFGCPRNDNLLPPPPPGRPTEKGESSLHKY